jgi:hypothetical protein
MELYVRSTAANSFLEHLAKYKENEFENNLIYFLQTAWLVIKKKIGLLKMDLVLIKGWFKVSILFSTLDSVLSKNCQYYCRNFY